MLGHVVRLPGRCRSGIVPLERSVQDKDAEACARVLEGGRHRGGRRRRCWPSRSRSSNFIGRDFVADALGPIAVLPETSADDVGRRCAGAGRQRRSLPAGAGTARRRSRASTRSVRSPGCRAVATILRETEAPADDDSASKGDALDAPLASYDGRVATAAEASRCSPPPSRRSPLLTAPQAEFAHAGAASASRHAGRLSGAAAATVQSAADRRVAVAVPVPGQGAADRQHRELLRLHRPVRGTRSALSASTRAAVSSSSAFRRTISADRSRASNQEIAQFCRLTYGVQFPMFEKSSVTKVSANPLFAS